MPAVLELVSLLYRTGFTNKHKGFKYVKTGSTSKQALKVNTSLRMLCGAQSFVLK